LPHDDFEFKWHKMDGKQASSKVETISL
jgi:hypothetical protein